MRSHYFSDTTKTVFVAAIVLLLTATMAVAQQTVSLTAGPATVTLPDGQTVPMWGYSCGATNGATCAALNPNNNGWSPVVITVTTGQDLQINLTNNLSFAAGNGKNSVPTSLVIVGQLGGGLGNSATTAPSPAHGAQSSTWNIANAPGAINNPPPQGPRVQSFSTEVAAGSTTTLTWTAPRAGTYLLESGTHPSIQGAMGLYGIVVVTTVPNGTTAGTAYPGVNYNAEVPLLLSEIDATQNKAVSVAVTSQGFSESATLGSYAQEPVAALKLLTNGSGYSSAAVSISGGGGTGATAHAVVDSDSTSATYQQVTQIVLDNGGSGYTSAPTVTVTGTGGSGATAEAALQLGTSTTCSNGSPSTACYPPVVNYTPLYYLVNGVAFDTTHAATSLFSAVPASGVSGNVLVRLVNAGVRMHVPSIVGSQTGTSAASGFSLIAEDGNVLPGLPRVQSEVFMAPGKTYDVMINAPAGGSALPFFDRQLSLSGNATERDAGMLAYIGVNGSTPPAAVGLGTAIANPDTYNSVVAGKTLTIVDASKGVIANDVNVYGVTVTKPPTYGTLTLSANGTFSYVPDNTWGSTTTTDTFVYIANGNGPTATVTLNAATIEGSNGISCSGLTFNATTATYLSVKTPGVLLGCKDAANYPLTVAMSTVKSSTGLTVVSDANGGFTAKASGSNTYTFTFQAQNSQGTLSAPVTATVIFPRGSGLQVTVLDGKDKTTQISDYRWVIEEDRTFYVDPTKTTNDGTTAPPTFGVNFHTSFMPVIATGCAGPAGALACESGQSLLGQKAVCDVGNGVCRTDATQQTAVDPSQVVLDPHKRYYISVLPGDAANPFNSGNSLPGHGMGGAPIAAGQTSVTVLTEPTPLQAAKLSVFVFEDDFPLNGEQDAGGGVDVLAPNEPGLGGFNITIFDDAGGSGDATGQVDYDMFNQPLSNALAGTPDPSNGNIDACPIGNSRSGVAGETGITGMIVTCPKYEADGKSLSPLAGQAVVANMMPGRYGIVATPGADRIGKGEEWLQTNTLDGQKAHDAFLKVGEPAYFQEYGPASFHVSIGFANPAIINGRLAGVCNGSDINVTGTDCKNTVTGKITTERMSRTPDERLYSSGSRDSFAFSQCYVSVGDPDGEDFAFTKCAADGTFSISGLPDGNWRVTAFDQWNDQLVDGLSTPVQLSGGTTVNMGDIATNQWQANLYTRTFLDANGDGVAQNSEAGIALIPTNIRYRDGSFSNFGHATDNNGVVNFNEVFPLFNWYVVETDSTRYKSTGTHVVYDAGGPADGTKSCGDGTSFPKCGTSTQYSYLANTWETNPIPGNLHVPGAVYCNHADCSGQSITDGPNTGSAPNSTGRIDPPWVAAEGWQGYSGQNSFLEFGKAPYVPGENGGIKGHVVYASTRPFDDPQLLLQVQWDPLVPHVTINLYQEGTAPDGTQSLKLVDTTQTSSWDDWSQGFRSDGMPNMNCPGQATTDLFYFSLYNQPQYLDVYNNGGNGTPLPANSQFKCYDGMHNWNQLQPAPYDGMYQFPSVTGLDPRTGKPTGTNCTACVKNPDSTDPYRYNTPMLPAGKYVVEVVVPPGYELVKEEDKNILIGDNFIAPVTQEFGGLGNIFILPDQAAIGAAYNANNAQNQTQNLGTSATGGIDATKSEEQAWPCVGELRTVPDYISLFPQSQEVAPFAGATRHLCDRKEVTLADQTSSQAKFYIFTPAHVAAHFTGVITDDFTSEFDPFSPQFGEKFAPPNQPISVKDWAGNETNRIYSDHWGAYDGLTYSTWEVNPPNPTGYSPTMMVMCMNDPGTGSSPDPLFNPGYSQFCYELPFMPGQTQYTDTPVTPTSAFSEGYNHPDCAYPDATPAVSEVDGDGTGPWVSAAGKTLTINSLGDQQVLNNGYSGPSAKTAPFNQKTINRHYGFGNTQGTVTIGGQPATITAWGDSQIKVTVPQNVPACAVQQQAQYGGSPAQCGELVVTAANGKQSVDAVTVTIGGKAPTVLPSGTTIQSAIDAAAPGDLIIVPQGAYNEILVMWKPVRLQGVGAASSVINANTQPAGKLTPWRAQISCVFGLSLNGQPDTYGAKGNGSNPFDPTGQQSCPGTGWNYFVGASNQPQVDRLPLEGILGWDTTVNGNLAQLLQEPTLMGAYEGAGITVLGKGVNIPSNATDIFGSGAESAFPAGTTLLGTADCTSGANGTNPYPSNFQCNPSSIDGLSITNSSQGGGGLYVHAWGHNLQIANNRIYNNSGTLTGGITVGQGESPDAYLQGSVTDSDPGSCQSGGQPNTQLPYCFNLNVNAHNNAVTLNSSIGDELYSSTPAGAGGVTFCTGADYYKFNYNWVCGNLSTGDGGGMAHLGFSYNGDIEHNSFLFNQSTNPTVPTNGGGLIVMGAPPDGLTAAGLECGNTVADADCAPGLSDGTGPNLVINANLFQGNSAESGSGGGLRFQGVNGTDVVNFPTQPTQWNNVSVTNNIISNNVAGWDGAGISLQDALNVDIINNTIMSNDTTASSGVLFNTLGASLASSQGQNCMQPGDPTKSCPQPAGLVAIQHSSVLGSVMPSTVVCPTGHPNCANVSYPRLYNDVFWQNRSFYIGVGPLGTGNQNQQNVVALYNSFTKTQAPSQPQAGANQANGNGAVIVGGTGACPSANYWDIGVRGDTGPTDHSSKITLAPTYSVLTDANDYSGGSNLGSNPDALSQYCNGSRVPPEFGGMGYQVPSGISDATVPNPIFNLTPSATVDEGNNWINISWGPLALTNSVTGVQLGNYALAAGSPAIGYIPPSAPTYAVAPPTDFFGNPRPPVPGAAIEVGAVQVQAQAPPTLTSIVPAMGILGRSVPVTITGTGLTGTTAVALSGAGINVTSLSVVNDTTVTATFVIATTAPLGARNVTVTTPGGSATLNNSFTVVGPTLISITPTPVALGDSYFVTLTGYGLTGATAVNVSGTGLTVTGVTVVNDTTITATFTISPGAGLGPRTVSVNTPIGPTNSLTFTVVPPPPPTLTAVTPNIGFRTKTVPVTLTGTNFTTLGTTARVTGTGITVSGVTVVNPTTATANFVISSSAAYGARSVSVVVPHGESATLVNAFTVVPPPTLASISPNAGTRGSSVGVTLTGTNFTTIGTSLSPMPGVTISGLTVVNSTTLTATLTISPTASLGAKSLRVITPAGSSSAMTFTVGNPAAPTLTQVSPNKGTHGTAVSVTLTGTNFTPAGTTVAVPGGGVTISSLTVVNSTTLTATFNITSAAARTARAVTVTNPGGTSGGITFTVN